MFIHMFDTWHLGPNQSCPMQEPLLLVQRQVSCSVLVTSLACLRQLATETWRGTMLFVPFLSMNTTCWLKHAKTSQDLSTKSPEEAAAVGTFNFPGPCFVPKATSKKQKTWFRSVECMCGTLGCQSLPGWDEVVYDMSGYFPFGGSFHRCSITIGGGSDTCSGLPGNAWQRGDVLILLETWEHPQYEWPALQVVQRPKQWRSCTPSVGGCPARRRRLV